MLTKFKAALQFAERTRAYLHRVVATLAGAGVLTGVVTAVVGNEQAGIAVTLICAVLGVSPVVASANTATKKPDPAPKQD